MDVDLEKDLLNSIEIRNHCNHSMVYSQNLYAALCNNRFFYNDKEWTCSWRHAGSIVSEINGGDDYLDFYCSGMVNNNGFVSEGTVTDTIRLDLRKLGWDIKSYNKN